MYFGHAQVYETAIWTPCFQILAKTWPHMPMGDMEERIHWKGYCDGRYTVPTFNSCTKCLVRPGIIHDRTPNFHPVPWTWMHVRPHN